MRSLSFVLVFMRMVHRQRHRERGSDSKSTVRHDLSTVALDDFATDRQSNARSFVSPASMQAFKHRENAFRVLFFEADAVVGDCDLRAVAFDAARSEERRVGKECRSRW